MVEGGGIIGSFPREVHGSCLDVRDGLMLPLARVIVSDSSVSLRVFGIGSTVALGFVRLWQRWSTQSEGRAVFMQSDDGLVCPFLHRRRSRRSFLRSCAVMWAASPNKVRE